jgi:hypothetical protein
MAKVPGKNGEKDGWTVVKNDVCSGSGHFRESGVLLSNPPTTEVGVCVRARLAL